LFLLPETDFVDCEQFTVGYSDSVFDEGSKTRIRNYTIFPFRDLE